MTTTADLRILLQAVPGAPFGERISRQEDVPAGLDLPYAAILEDLSGSPALEGDGAALAWRAQAQVDVFFETPVRDADLDLVEKVVETIDGARQGGFRFRVLGWVRVPEAAGTEGETAGQDVGHVAITVQRSRVR